MKNSLISREIASGHAFEKHVMNQGEFPGWIRTRNQLAGHVESIINNPTATKMLSKNRTGYWYEPSGTVVIYNPSAVDGGTAFQPTKGIQYFLKELR